MLSKMADERKLKQINKNAILIHQLLPEDKNSALSYFSTESIEKASCISEGLRVFFKEYDLVKKTIIRQRIEVKGLFYKIYPMVTNLTVIGIGPYATNSAVEDIMQYYGFIIDSYRIQEMFQLNGCQTVSLTNDYRIILDIPEVFAPKLRSITLPDIKNKTFEVLFFCRLCRSNGHMQFQCSMIATRSPSSFSYCQSRDVCRRTSYENNLSDSVFNNDTIRCPQSDFCFDQRNSKISPNSYVKTEKEQDYFPDQSYSHSSSFTYHQSKDVSRRKSYDSGELCINNKGINRRQSDFCPDNRNYETRLDSHMTTNKKQNYFSGKKNCYSKKSSYTSNSTYHQSTVVSERAPCENNSADLPIDNDVISSSASDFCVDRRNLKIRSDSNIKNRKMQNHELSDQNCYPRNKSHKNHILRRSYVKSIQSKSRNFHNRHYTTDYAKKHQNDKFSSMPIHQNEKCKDKNSSVFKEPPTERSLDKRNAHQHCENEEDIEMIQASISDECSGNRTSKQDSKRNKRKTKLMDILSCLLPPDINLLKTAKLIKIALKCESKDIPAEVKALLLSISKYNSGLNDKTVTEEATDVLKWIKVLVSKIKKQERVQCKKSHKDPIKHSTKDQEHVKEGNSAIEIPKQRSPGKRKVVLSLGIREAISKTSGELKPTLLRNFLNQVRGRRKLFEVTSVFTKNITALVSQLLELQNTYYKCVQKRGADEDRDISFIKRLTKRLQEHNGNAPGVVLDREVSIAEVPSEIESEMTEVSVKAELDMAELSIKTEPNTAEISVKTESNMTEMLAKESNITEMSVKKNSDMTETPVKREAGVAEIFVKRENEIFMRQSSNCEYSSPNSLYGQPNSLYYTNITQMPFSLTSIKAEVTDID